MIMPGPRADRRATEKLAIEADASLDEFDDIAGQADHALHIIRAASHKIDDFAALDRLAPPRIHHRKYEVAQQQAGLHRLRRNAEAAQRDKVALAQLDG